MLLRSTTTALLEQLLDPSDERVWREFDARYRPVIAGFARRLGLSEADAEDIAQETLVRFVDRYREGAYDRQRGRLSAWMTGIARNCVADAKRTRAARREHRGQSALDGIADSSELETIWGEECNRTIVARAMGVLREGTRLAARTIRAFELLAIDQRAPEDVAAELQISIDSVYAAKHRCAGQLREIVSRLREDYELE